VEEWNPGQGTPIPDVREQSCGEEEQLGKEEELR
jgi:hypothetical protein